MNLEEMLLNTKSTTKQNKIKAIFKNEQMKKISHRIKL